MPNDGSDPMEIMKALDRFSQVNDMLSGMVNQVMQNGFTREQACTIVAALFVQEKQ